MKQPPVRYADSPGGKIAYQVVGDGPIDLFFAPTGTVHLDIAWMSDVDDRVLATVLFTDIVGSTEQASRMGDRRWRELLDLHDTLVQREIERFRGRQIKTTGDGILATFDGPARAIRCAMAIKEVVRSLGIDIRIGLHTGEVERRGEDVGGIAVHIGARVMAEAGPGVVLVSGSVPPLVAGSGIDFEDRGERELKGVPGTWRLHEVTST